MKDLLLVLFIFTAEKQPRFAQRPQRPTQELV